MHLQLSKRDAVHRARAALRESVRAGLDPMPMLHRVTSEALRLIPRADGTAIELFDGELLVYACAAGTLSCATGRRHPTNKSLSGAAVSTRRTLICHDTTTDERTSEDIAAGLGAASLICVPLLAGPTVIGVLEVAADEVRAFGVRDVRVLAKLATFIAAAIGAAVDLSTLAVNLIDRNETDGDQSDVAGFVAEVLHPGIVAEAETRDAVERTIQQRALRILHQPIVDLASGRTVGVEALVRFDLAPSTAPDEYIRRAHAVGLGTELELAAVEAALDTLPDLAPDRYLAINVGPVAATDDRLVQVIPDATRERLVLEITEHDHIRNYDSVREGVRQLRATGVRLAADDIGTGIAGLAHLLELSPDIIKLDRVLIRGIHKDQARLALAAGIATFARDVGAIITAEGIEVAPEVDAALRMGIPTGQGYFFGRPARPARRRAGASSAS